MPTEDRGTSAHEVVGSTPGWCDCGRWCGTVAAEVRHRIAVALGDLLTMLGVDPDESSRDNLDGRTTAEVLADAALAEIGDPVTHSQLVGIVAELVEMKSPGTAMRIAGDLLWRLDIRHKPLPLASTSDGGH